MSGRISISVGVLATCAVVASARGGGCIVRTVGVEPGVVVSRSLGSAVAGAGDVVVAGAPYADASGFESGAAVVYRIEGHGLVLDEMLSAAGIGAGDRFGFAVASDGVRIAVGSPDDSGTAGGSGSARVFREVGGVWITDPIVFAPDARTGDRFGASAAIEGDTLIVGAPSFGDDQRGAVYVFVWDGSAWGYAQTLESPDADANDHFGASLALDGGRLLIGAFGDDEGGIDTGAGYIYERDDAVWSFSTKLISNNGAAGDLCGWSVALENDLAVLGAPGRDDAGSMSGCAFVFDFQGGAWAEQTTLSASHAGAFDRGGSSVAIGGGRVIVGSPRDDSDGNNAGGAAVFTRSAGVWSEAALLRTPVGHAGGEFGSGAALIDGIAVIGAPKAAGGGRLFAIPAVEDCDASGALDACEVASGVLIDADDDLVPDACDPPRCIGDATGNGVVDVRDLNLVLAFWNQQPYEPFLGADITGDGFVDVDDLNVVLAYWACERE